MEDALRSLDPNDDVVGAIVFVVGIVVLTKLGMDWLARELVEIYSIFLAVGTIASVIIIAKLYQKAVGGRRKPTV